MLSVETIIENTIITRNIAVGAEDRADAAAGVTTYQDLIIGAGTQIYGNICENKECLIIFKFSTSYNQFCICTLRRSNRNGSTARAILI